MKKLIFVFGSLALIAGVLHLQKSANSASPAKFLNHPDDQSQAIQRIKWTDGGQHTGDSAQPASRNTIVTASLREIEREFSSFRDEEIRRELKSIESTMARRNLVAKANSGSLSDTEVLQLTESLRKKAALHKLLLERQITRLKERI